MKKKIIFGATVCLFAVVTMFNINMSQQDNASNISLKNIEVMTQANAEITWGPFCAHVIPWVCTTDGGVTIYGYRQYF